MRSILLSTVVAATLAAISIPAAVTSADASGFCGPYAHRNYYGACRPNFARPYGFYRPYGYGGWHRGWGWHRRHW
jgi:hypothetical protein